MARPIAPPRWNLETTIAALHTALDRQPADVPVSVGRAALAHLERMHDQERELYALRSEQERWEEWRQAYDPIWNAARARGIEIGQPFGSDTWHWTNGKRRGQAPTPGQALLDALRAARQDD